MTTMGARAVRTADSESRTDAELAVAAADGSSDAFEALYRRHAPTAWRVAYSVTGNKDDASDAVSDAFTRVLQALPAGRLVDASLFRSYLLSATRNAAIDSSRRGSRLQHTDRLDRLDDGQRVTTPGDRVAYAEDVTLVAQAFRSLPERWRSVLWLTEVEGIPPRDAAAMLGVTPNNAAQLAVRARAGLRERFVQAHLTHGTAVVPDECRACIDRLGAYVTGRLTPRDLAKVDQHLAGCGDCRERHTQLEDVGGTLRRIAVPLPLVLGSAAAAKWKLASATSVGDVVAHPVASAATSTASWSTELALKLQKPLIAASTGIFALGVISASVMGSPRQGLDTPDGARTPVTQAAPGETPIVTPRVVQLVSIPSQLPDGLDVSDVGADAGAGAGALPPTEGDAFAFPLVGPPVVAQPIANSTGASTGGGGGDDGSGDDAGPTVEVGIAGRAGPLDGGLVLGDGCQGGSLGGQSMGCEPPEAAAPTAGITVVTDGEGPLAGQSHTLGF